MPPPPYARGAPGLRLLVERGRVLRGRPVAPLGGLIARTGAVGAHALWPTPEQPLIGVDLAHAPAAEWLRATFERDSRAPRAVGASTWNALRAGGLVVGTPSRLTIEAARRGLGRELRRPRLCIYSPTGTRASKVTCFVFEEGEAAPSVVVKAMPQVHDSRRLRHETEIVDSLRRRLTAGTARALPLAPLPAGGIDGDYVVVQPLDPLAAHSGRATRHAALRWLYAFQAETCAGSRAWGSADDASHLEEVSYAWSRVRGRSEPGFTARVGELLEQLRGRPVRRCAVHGDFWRGNLAAADGQLRVYDWEWARAEGDPFFDLWTYELAELRQHVEHRSGDPEALLSEALERVRAELRAHGMDPRFALATAAPTLARLTFRVRRATGLAGGGEDASARLMAALEGLMLGHGWAPRARRRRRRGSAPPSAAR